VIAAVGSVPHNRRAVPAGREGVRGALSGYGTIVSGESPELGDHGDQRHRRDRATSTATAGDTTAASWAPAPRALHAITSWQRRIWES